MFEKQVQKAKEKGKSYVTIRRDVARRFIENNEVVVRCRFHYTDDYAWDNENNFGRGQVSKETLLEKMDLINAWCYMSVNKPDVLTVHIHSNLVYEVTMPGKPEEPAEPEPVAQPKPANNVINFVQRAVEKKADDWQKSLTPEQKLKIITLNHMMGHDKFMEALTLLNFDVDELFKVAALAYEKLALK